MRRFRFISERDNLRSGSSVKLTDFEANHANKTLRLKKGDYIFIFNGKKEYKAQLKIVSKEVVIAEIVEEVAKIEPDSNIILFQALTKPKSFELILEKTTELGVTEIYPVKNEYSVIHKEVTIKKLERWTKIIQTSTKQSERIDIPTIHKAVDFESSIKISQVYSQKLVFTTNSKELEVKAKKIDNLELNHSEVAIFIGPEGGFSQNELEVFYNNGFQFVKLTNTVLRSETAAILSVGYIRLKLNS